MRFINSRFATIQKRAAACHSKLEDLTNSMSRFFQPRDLLIAALAAALAVSLSALWLRRPPAPVPHAAPDLGSLQQSLEKAAETALPALPLSSGQISVKAGNEAPDARAKEIAALAGQFGGSGIVSQKDGKTSVLAQIPGNHAAEFYRKLTGHDMPPPAGEEAAKDGQWFDISITK